MLTLTWPIETPAHRLSVWSKLLTVSAVSAFALSTNNPAYLAAALVLLAFANLCLGVAFSCYAAKLLLNLWPFAVVIIAWHLVTRSGFDGLIIIARMTVAVGAANLMTMTTRLDELLSFIRRGLEAVGLRGKNSRAAAMSVTLLIRFTPVLLERISELRHAWMARSARRPSVAILPSLLVSAMDDADQIAEAIRARGGI